MLLNIPASILNICAYSIFLGHVYLNKISNMKLIIEKIIKLPEKKIKFTEKNHMKLKQLRDKTPTQEFQNL